MTILLGYALRRLLLPDPVVWAGLERLAYFVLLPALLVHSLATADLAMAATWRLVVAVLMAILLTGAAAFALRRPLGLSGPVFASLFQGATRMNAYVILGLASSLTGPAGLAMASLVLAFMAILVNFLAVVVLVRYGERGGAPEAGSAHFLKSLTGNPLILASLIGVLWNLSGAPMPSLIGAPLSFVSSAAVGVALLSVGAALELRRVFADPMIVAITCGLKLILLPAFFFVLARLLELDGQASLVGIVCCAVPVSTSAYIMAKQLGGDADLMARLVTAMNLAAMATMLPWLALVTGAG